jgi:hypothetical protein
MHRAISRTYEVSPVLNYKINRSASVLIRVRYSYSRPLPLHQPARLTARSFHHRTINLRHRLTMNQQKLITATKVSLRRQSAQKL